MFYKEIDFNFKALLLLTALLWGFVACSPEEEVPEPTIPTPTIRIEAGESSATALSFMVNSTNAATVEWYCLVEGLEEYTQSEHRGEARTNRNDEVVAVGLKPVTTYTIVAVARNGKHAVESNTIQMTTLDLVEPTVALQEVELTSTRMKFSITSSEASEVRWYCVEADKSFGEKQLLKKGSRATPNTTVTLTTSVLSPATAYTLYALALNARYQSPMVELDFTTPAEEQTPDQMPDDGADDGGNGGDDDSGEELPDEEPAEPGFGGDITPEVGPVVKP